MGHSLEIKEPLVLRIPDFIGLIKVGLSGFYSACVNGKSKVSSDKSTRVRLFISPALAGGSRVTVSRRLMKEQEY
jgi:hypothetical protein